MDERFRGRLPQPPSDDVPPWFADEFRARQKKVKIKILKYFKDQRSGTFGQLRQSGNQFSLRECLYAVESLVFDGILATAEEVAPLYHGSRAMRAFKVYRLAVEAGSEDGGDGNQAG